MAVNFLGNFNFQKVIKNFAADPNPCPDQVVGIMFKSAFLTFKERVNVDYLTPSKVSNDLTDPIVVILESPYKMEFDPITLMAHGSAMGETGKKFKEHFMSALKDSPIYQHVYNSPHDIVLVNAVQYQCKPVLATDKSNEKDEHKDTTPKEKTSENGVAEQENTVTKGSTVQTADDVQNAEPEVKEGKAENKNIEDTKIKNLEKCFENGAAEDFELRLRALNPFAVINLCTEPFCAKVAAIASAFKNFICGNHPSSWRTPQTIKIYCEPQYPRCKPAKKASNSKNNDAEANIKPTSGETKLKNSRPNKEHKNPLKPNNELNH